MLGGDAKPTRAPRETRKRKSVAKERVERDEEDLVRLYLTDIGQYPLLTKDDEVRLAQAIEGGNAARCELEKVQGVDGAGLYTWNVAEGEHNILAILLGLVDELPRGLEGDLLLNGR